VSSHTEHIIQFCLLTSFQNSWFGIVMVTCPMTSRDPKGAVRQYGRLS